MRNVTGRLPRMNCYGITGYGVEIVTGQRKFVNIKQMNEISSKEYNDQKKNL